MRNIACAIVLAAMVLGTGSRTLSDAASAAMTIIALLLLAGVLWPEGGKK